MLLAGNTSLCEMAYPVFDIERALMNSRDARLRCASSPSQPAHITHHTPFDEHNLAAFRTSVPLCVCSVSVPYCYDAHIMPHSYRPDPHLCPACSYSACAVDAHRRLATSPPATSVLMPSCRDRINDCIHAIAEVLRRNAGTPKPSSDTVTQSLTRAPQLRTVTRPSATWMTTASTPTSASRRPRRRRLRRARAPPIRSSGSLIELPHPISLLRSLSSLQFE